MAYVEIERHFRDIGKEALSPATRRMMRGVRDPLTWNALLGESTKHVVLVAPSGTGKSTEMQEQAKRLRAEGRLAFFGTARAIAEHRFDADALEGRDDARAFDAWRQTGSRAVVFVDGVDELVLVGRDLQSLTRRLVRVLDPEADWQLVVSVRTGGWSGKFAQHLASRLVDKKAEEVFREVTFEPLDDMAVRKLAEAADCQDLAGFMRAFDEAEVDAMVDLRPTDITPLVQGWNSEKQIASWARVLEDFVDNALVAGSRDRDHARELTLEQGRRGARRIGAAALFVQKPFVALPSEGALEGAISARQLFADWRLQPLRELLESPLFVSKSAEAVQLALGSLSPFLAARWLAERCHAGKSAEWLRDRLLVRIEGDDDYIVPGSRRETVGWLASLVPAFRRLLLRSYPEIVLYEGDPDLLQDSEIVDGLDAVLASLHTDQRNLFPSRGTVQKLARPALEGPIVGLLRKHTAGEAQALLLHWCAIGRYSTAIPVALETARSEVASATARMIAIRVVAACGTETDRRALLPLTDSNDDYIRAELIPALIPGQLSGAPLVDFLFRGGDRGFLYPLEQHAREIRTEDLDALIERLLPSLEGSVVTGETIRHLDLAVVVVAERAGRADPPDSLVEGLLAIESYEHRTPRFAESSDKQKIDHHLRNNLELRRRLWTLRFEGDAHDEYSSHFSEAVYGRPTIEDIPFLFSVAESSEANGSMAMPWISRIVAAMRPEQRDALVENPDLPPRLREYLESNIAARQQHEQEFLASEEEQQRQAEETRAKNTAYLTTIRTEIALAENVNALTWGLQYLYGRSTTRRSVDPKRLASVIGPELVPDFVRGYKALWRKQPVELPEPGDPSPEYKILAAFTGIGLEVNDGLDFSTLSPELARHASRYAMYELNGFPGWFADLVAAHPDVVKIELRAAIELAWDSTKADADASLIRYAPHEPRTVALLLRGIVIDLLVDRPPATAAVLRAAVSACLLSSTGLREVAAAARRAVESLAGQTDERLREWLRLWAHLEPEEAASWLEEQLRDQPERTRQLFIEVAGLLEVDFDERRSQVAASRLMDPPALERWIGLLLNEVRPEEDIEHVGGYSPVPRDHAQDFRGRCLERLASDPSPLARATLVRLAGSSALSAYAADATRLLSHQRSVAAEAAATPWTEADIVTVEYGDERPPRSMADLFALVRAHVTDVGRIVESDEFSYRELFDTKTHEREIQLWVASCLGQRARGLYSVVRENVVDKDKEVDITAVADGVGQVPVEIKPAHPYSAKDLEKVIRDQLIGQYMTQQDRTLGILLLVHHGKKPRGWTINGESGKHVRELTAHLREYAREVASLRGKTVAVELIDIEGSRKTEKTEKRAKPKTGKPGKKSK